MESSSTQKSSQLFTHLLVIDFEAVFCPNKILPHEIIEFPIVVVDLTQPVSGSRHIAATISSNEFHRYVKPTKHLKLNEVCVEITGIQQEWLDSAGDWKIVWEESQLWIKNWEKTAKIKNGVQPNWAIVTCGDWDLKTMLPAQMKLADLTVPPAFQQWINIKVPFTSFYRFKNRCGMKGMLEKLRLTLDGRHHSGIDDSRNIAKIVKKLIEDGCVLNITGRISESPPDPSRIGVLFGPEAEAIRRKLDHHIKMDLKKNNLEKKRLQLEGQKLEFERTRLDYKERKQTREYGERSNQQEFLKSIIEFMMAMKKN